MDKDLEQMAKDYKNAMCLNPADNYTEMDVEDRAERAYLEALQLSAERERELQQIIDNNANYQAGYNNGYDDSRDEIAKLQQENTELKAIGARLLEAHNRSDVDWFSFRQLEKALKGL